MYIFDLLSIIFSREDDVGGLHAIHPTQGLPIAAAVTFTQIGIDHTNMRPFVSRFVNRLLQVRCHMTVKYLNLCVSGQCGIR
jgi:hypothetical protein